MADDSTDPRRARFVDAARRLRKVLPGDSQLGDPLSTAGDRPTDLLARAVAEAATQRPSLSRELGLGALQVWQALSETQGRGQGEQELTILFTDLVDFSSWALGAGDDTALELLRQVGRAQEPPVRERGGRVIKRLGDGLMAVFEDPAEALNAAHEARANVAALEVAGHRPSLRCGLHLGRPRKLGGDYLGVDVNIAARVVAAAGGDQVLISEPLRARLDERTVRVKRLRSFRAKGTPKELGVYVAEPA